MHQLCVATIDSRVWELAEKYDLGIELDQFCTAMYMDMPDFPKYDADARRMLGRAKVFHGPFSELSPCAIDPRVRKLSMERYNQAYNLMRRYGLSKMVLHGGYIPLVYFPQWYVERSIEFWKEFLIDKPEDFILCLENVMESQPSFLVDIVRGVNDRRCRLCLDIGHVHAGGVSNVPIPEWIEAFAPYLAHVHLHNNDSSWDWHKSIGNGTIDIDRVLDMLDRLTPDVSYTFENIDDTEESIQYYLYRKRK